MNHATQGIVITTLLSFLTTNAVANGMCDAKWLNAKKLNQQTKAGAGDLIDLKSNAVLETDKNDFQNHSKTLQLGYVVPRSADKTGASIIKIRHQLKAEKTRDDKTAKDAFPGSNLIRLERPTYVSPCTNKQIREYKFSAKIVEYIDHTHFGFRDDTNNDENNLSLLHAYIGTRDRTFFFLLFPFTRSVCTWTYDPKIRGNYSYDQTQAIASPREISERQTARIKGPELVGSAFAAPNQYRDQLHTIVLPYVRNQEDNCVRLNIQAPDRAVSTDITIVDADQALLSIWPFTPQTTWTLNWGDK